MAGWNGSGVFTFPYSWEADAAAGIDILASRMDTQFDTVSVDGFGNTLTRDGQGQPTANLPMANFKHTGAAVATASGQYLVYQQVVGGSLAATFSTVTTSGTITAGSTLTVSAGGLKVTLGGVTISAGGLLVSAGGAGIVGGLTIATNGLIIQSGTVSLSPSTGNVDISPVAGTLVINPGTAGTINKMAIGGTTPAAGTFTTLIANNGTTGSQVVNYSQFPATTGSPGTMTFPNGVIHKWGTGTTASGSTTITYGAAFPAATDNVSLTISGGSGTASYHPLIVGTATASGFDVWGDAGESLSFNWFATGH